MKTTLDLPDLLIKQVKLRALRDGRKLKDEVADLLRKGLAASADSQSEAAAVVVNDKQTGLPVIQCRQAPPPDEELTTERVADILLAQEYRVASVASCRGPITSFGWKREIRSSNSKNLDLVLLSKT